jgi:hypothetical protein
MRVLFGMLLGVMLTIGAAFVSDTWTSGPPATNGSATAAVERHTMVNWDVVGENLRIVRQRAREAWTKLSHMVTS